jgi:acetyltransferase-like isoleucine patch superfamily enzyme
MRWLDHVLMRLSLRIVDIQNIEYEKAEEAQIFKPGCYFAAYGKIIIGKGTWIGPNVGLITANHDLYYLSKNQAAKPISIGRNCWIGMNSVVLPGVTLGDHTIVGAGSVVTKSFLDGNQLIAGNPAKVIRCLESS